MPDDTKLVLTVDGVSQELHVLRFEGHEGISQLFEFEVTFACPDAALDFSNFVRKAATLTMNVDADAPRVVNGIVSRIEEDNPDLKWAYYRLTIVPQAWVMMHRMDCRIFQSMTVPAIVEAVLKGAGLVSGSGYKLALQGAYSARDYCVQYRESDWDFVCRLLEEEGIYYYIDTSPDAGDQLVLGDQTAAYPAIPGTTTLKFQASAGALGGYDVPGDHVKTFQYSQQIRSGKTTMRDWNFLKPALLLESTQSAAPNADLELYDFPGEYQIPGDGDGLAVVRLAEQKAGITIATGEGTCSRLAAAHTFTLADHPRDAFNGSYVVTRVHHRGANPESQRAGEEGESAYQNEFEVIPAATLFRPPRLTRRPHIHGVQTAVVVGPAGEEIYVDANCRVKVQFHWDRLGKKDDKSSCWIRVAQTWASASFGAMFIPRINDEVVVTFLEGDPDQPLIVGSIYHGTNVPPYALPDNKTRSTIKSRSTPQGGDGYNELRLEDKKGSEEVYLHGQKDWTILIENDKNQTVGHDETAHVKHDRTKNVDHDQTATIGHDDTLEVKNDQTMTVDHDQSLTVKNNRTTTVQNDHTESVSGNQSVTITKAQTVAISDKQEITVSKTRSLSVTGDVSETFQAKLTVAVTGDVAETMSAKRTVSVSSDHAESIGGKESISITGDSVETVGGKKTFTVTGNVTITSGSSTVTIKPSGEISISGVKMSIDASGPLEISGATVDVKSTGPATYKAATVTNSADAAYTLKGAMITLDGQMISVG